MFVKGKLYSRKDIYKLLEVPTEKQKGIWNTGYAKYNNEYFIFAGIDTTGRTGHDYNNHWEGNILYWRGKNNSSFNQNTSKELISSNFNIHVFTRTDNKNIQFTYEGLGQVEKIEDTSPITIYWGFENQIECEENTVHEHGEIYGVEDRKKAVSDFEIKDGYKYWKRDSKVVDNVIKTAGYMCEEDISHYHFKSEATGMNYVEGHHLIPMKYQDMFPYSLDVEANVISLCVVCHKKLHLANIEEKVDIIKKLHKNRVERLRKSGIYIGVEDLIDLYLK